MNKELRKKIEDKIWWHIYKWGGWKGLSGGFVNIKRLNLKEENGITTATCYVEEGVQDTGAGGVTYSGEYVFKLDKDLNFITKRR